LRTTILLMIVWTGCGTAPSHSIVIMTPSRAAEFGIGAGGYEAGPYDREHLRCISPSGISASAQRIRQRAVERQRTRGWSLVGDEGQLDVLFWRCSAGQCAAEPANRDGLLRLSIDADIDLLALELRFIPDEGPAREDHAAAAELHSYLGELVNCVAEAPRSS
jgi:hypothetical protein